MSRFRPEVGADEIRDYPFALILRLRVFQVVCGISMGLMGAVALIEEKTPFNVALGVPAGLFTVLAAAHNIYCSRGFDGYQPSDSKLTPFRRNLRILGPTFKVRAINLLLWGGASALLVYLDVKIFQVLCMKKQYEQLDEPRSFSLDIIAGIEFALTMAVFCTIIAVTWVDLHYDPDYHDAPDLSHSNTGTAVSMVTVSQTAPV